MAVSKRTKKKWAESFHTGRNELFPEEVVRLVEAQAADPIAFSQLAYWLSLEVWSIEEGALVLAGVEPGTVQTSEGNPFHFGYTEWTNAMPFSQLATWYQLPESPDLRLEDFKGDVEAHDAYLERQEDRRAILKRHETLYKSLRHKLDHSPSALGASVHPDQYRPVAFLAWAGSINFKPEWWDWAQTRNRLPDDMHPGAPPYFDADASDYPDLLHIAVRAWEHARKSGDGTPKQRVLAYLESRYPKLPSGSRKAIAQVVNWQRAGGRPAKKA
jgi:hypothetical protein